MRSVFKPVSEYFIVAVVVVVVLYYHLGTGYLQYTGMPETNHVSRVYSVAAIL